MSTPSMPPGGRPPGYAVRGLLDRLSPRQRQYALLAAILGGGIGLLWLIFSFSATNHQPHGRAAPTQPGDVTNIGVLPPGGQVNPVTSGSVPRAESWPSTKPSARNRAGSTRSGRPSREERCSVSPNWSNA